MKKNIVFISWHSDKQEIGKKISKCFRDCFGNIFGKEISVFASHVDIKHGWTQELSDALHESKYGIILLTPQALDSAWMYYEFGVLRRIPGHVWCFPFGNVSREKTPFSINQYLEFSEEELKKMLDVIIKRELSDNFIGWIECDSIRKKVETEVPNLYSEVNKIAANIDNDYERNYIIREKYYNSLKNGVDSDASKKIFDLTSENDFLRIENKSLKEKNDSLSTENQFLKTENQSLKTENQSLKKDNLSIQSTIDQLKQELESASKKQSKASTSSSSSKFCNAIDLGLPSGTLWADRNIGAASPEGYGVYFAWGEISPKAGEYSWDTYKYKDNPQTLPSSHDAATQNWGSDWCMPTKEQFDELIENCMWTWKGNGYEVKGKNGNSIFLPAAGYRYNTILASEMEYGIYWSSSILGGDNPESARNLYFVSDLISNSFGYRYYGLPVRAVLRKE